MSGSVKSEPMDVDVVGGASKESVDVSALVAQIDELLKGNPEGITDEELREKTSNYDATQRQEAVNALLGLGRIQLAQMGRMLIYKPRDPEALGKMKGASAEESLVFQLVEEAGVTGIWIKDIRVRSGLAQTQLNKVLKGLESRKLIKCVRAVGAVRRKMYILFSLTPDEGLTGGAFYSDQEFDHEFAELLIQQCGKFLGQRAALATSRFPSDPLARKKLAFTATGAVRQHIADLEISKIALSADDVEKLLDVLVCEGRAERRAAHDGSATFRALPATGDEDPSGLAFAPCTACPVRRDCGPGAPVQPATCQYFQDWLS